jgi:hypothetical protein
MIIIAFPGRKDRREEVNSFHMITTNKTLFLVALNCNCFRTSAVFLLEALECTKLFISALRCIYSPSNPHPLKIDAYNSFRESPPSILLKSFQPSAIRIL